RRAVGARATQGEKLRPCANPQQRRLPLPRLNRHSEKTLIEIQRAFRIGHAQGHVVERSDRNRRVARRLCEKPRRNGQCRNGPQKTSSIDWVGHHALLVESLSAVQSEPRGFFVAPLKSLEAPPPDRSSMRDTRAASRPPRRPPRA